MDKYFYSKDGPGDTGISVNAGYGGRTILAIASHHMSEGDDTRSQIDMLRLGYSGDHLTVVNIANSGASSITSYTVSDTKIYINGPGTLRVIFISNKPFT